MVPEATSNDIHSDATRARAKRRRRTPVQLELPEIANAPVRKRSRGGKRANAGRKRAPGTRPSVRHVPRPVHHGAHPVHVTLRARRGLPPLRSQLVSDLLRGVLHRQRHPKRIYARAFQVVEFSIQEDHLHLIVEATGKEDAPDALRSGVSGLMIAFAKRLNRTLGRRGKVWGDRWHGRDLPNPREVRNVLVYVFRNLARHGTRMIGEGAVDDLSSAPRFDGWTTPVRPIIDPDSWPRAIPRTWLLERGWRVHGLINPREAQRLGP